MTLAECEYLLSSAGQALLAQHHDADPERLALRLAGQGVPAAAIASQLKYRLRAKVKLPAWLDAGCVFEGKAFEQCTSEAVAALKPWGGGTSALDLTCGLGVDTSALAGHYAQVVALEPDPVRHRLAQHNLALLGHPHVQLAPQTAEDWLAAHPDAAFDLVYLDPDRRDDAGQRHFRFADTTPNVRALLPTLLRIAPRVLLKASPMLDIAAALQELGVVHTVTVLAADGECKELLFDIRRGPATVTARAVAFLRHGQAHRYSPGPAQPAEEVPGEALLAMPYCYEADTALYKAGLAAAWFTETQASLQGAMNHPEGYCFSAVEAGDFPGRAYRIVAVLPYKPDRLRKYFQDLGIKQLNYTRRHFDIPLEQVRAQVKCKEGGRDLLLLTQVRKAGAWERVALHAVRV
jgi:THUMP domain-like/Methyltransferase domain